MHDDLSLNLLNGVLMHVSDDLAKNNSDGHDHSNSGCHHRQKLFGCSLETPVPGR